MKKTILTFGLISGAVSALLMLATVPFMHKIGFDKGLLVGYTTITLSLLFVFFGIRSYRENVGGGEITFLKALAIGLAISVISSVCYVITWEIVYFAFMPDFAEKYTNFVVEHLRASGATQEVISAKMNEMKDLKRLLDNPLTNAAMTFIEPFPVGLIITLISSAILRKKGPEVSKDQSGTGQSDNMLNQPSAL